MPGPELAAAVSEHPGGSAISLVVAPRSARNQIELQEDGSVRVRVTAPPVDGAANAALLKFLARALAVPRSRLSIISGESSRHKRIFVEGVAAPDVRARLGASRQPR